MSRVIRVLIYSGEPKEVRRTLMSSGVPLNGERLPPIRNLSIRSIITDVEDVTCLICELYKTSNKTLICDQCLAEAERRAKEAEDVQ